MPSEKITFAGSHDATLAGRLERPNGPVRAVALFAHCFTCSKDSLAAARISAALAARGIATLRFDFTGLGGSGGDFGSTSFSSNVEDLILAAEHLTSTIGAPQLLIGHSLGGAAVLSAARGIDSIRAVATIGAPSDPAHVAHLFTDALEEITTEGTATVKLAGREFEVRAEFVRDLASHTLLEEVAKLDASLLVMHSPEDETVSISHASKLFTAAKHPKSFVSLDGANHLLTRAEDSAWAADVISSWANRYLDACKDDRPEVGEGVRVTPTHLGKHQHYVRSGPHVTLADEPVHVGGDDTGFSPYEMLLGGLGACTSMTLRMYADHKGIPLEHVDVRLTHDKIHAKDCAECETEKGKVDLIEREIELVGDLTDEQRTRLIEIADRCPVHRTLNSEVRINTKER